MSADLNPPKAMCGYRQRVLFRSWVGKGGLLYEREHGPNPGQAQALLSGSGKLRQCVLRKEKPCHGAIDLGDHCSLTEIPT